MLRRRLWPASFTQFYLPLRKHQLTLSSQMLRKLEARSLMFFFCPDHPAGLDTFCCQPDCMAFNWSFYLFFLLILIMIFFPPFTYSLNNTLLKRKRGSLFAMCFSSTKWQQISHCSCARNDILTTWTLNEPRPPNLMSPHRLVGSPFWFYVSWQLSKLSWKTER